MRKIPVAVLGASGAVGQNFIKLLDKHPYFTINELYGNSTTGKTYTQAVHWGLDACLPTSVADMAIKSMDEKPASKIIFSALPAGLEQDHELELAKAGHYVFSNTRTHRMDQHVPLLVPEVNSRHLELVKYQGTEGFIVTNPNCSTIGLVTGIAPLHYKYGISEMSITTMQAISGAGLKGVAALDILGNIIPYIKGEEEKIAAETNKILGTLERDHVENAGIRIKASCYRVNVLNGHTIDAAITLRKQPPLEEVISTFEDYPHEDNCYSAPEKLIYVHEEPNRPQPRKDVNKDRGMAVSIGRIRYEEGRTLRMTILVNNVIRGAAGLSILNAERALKAGYGQ